ncbi:hypothetical protein [Pedobacter agri]|uniref:Tail fiber protein n=1 Tax=Pedobacter agri TaxID=454586 RepID=A0A9X3I8J7_9SPHI|nr:hypothetical protein [Pedobacter agri]MCX3264821.1 hypothetical protein [Pedobacter agri]
MIRKIEPADTLELGFRGKYNETIEEIPISGTLTSDGKLRLNKFGGGSVIEIPLLGLFYTKNEILQMFQGGLNLPVATENNRGVIQIATQIEVNAGDDDQKAVTAAKIKNSDLISWKGVWVQPGADEAYPVNVTVIRGTGIYLSLVNDNQSDPSLDPAKWRRVGGSDPKTTIQSNADFSINWQTDIVPNDGRTYAQKHGNNIGSITGIYDAGNGVMTPFTPNFTYTVNGTGGINIITFTEVFGPVTII